MPVNYTTQSISTREYNYISELFFIISIMFAQSTLRRYRLQGYKEINSKRSPGRPSLPSSVSTKQIIKMAATRNNLINTNSKSLAACKQNKIDSNWSVLSWIFLFTHKITNTGNEKIGIKLPYDKDIQPVVTGNYK